MHQRKFTLLLTVLQFFLMTLGALGAYTKNSLFLFIIRNSAPSPPLFLSVLPKGHNFFQGVEILPLMKIFLPPPKKLCPLGRTDKKRGGEGAEFLIINKKRLFLVYAPNAPNVMRKNYRTVSKSVNFLQCICL